MTQELSELHKRNGLMVRLLWICTALGLAASYRSLDIILAILCTAIPVAAVCTLFYLKKWYINQTMYFVAVGFNVICFTFMYASKSPGDYVILLLGLVLTSLYMDMKPLLLNGIIGLAVLIYFCFAIYVGENTLGINAYYLVTWLTLLGQSTIGKRLLKNMRYSMQESEQARQKMELLMTEVRQVSNVITTSGTELNGNANMAGKINNEVLLAFQEISTGMESQAGSVSDISTAMHELNESVQRTSDASNTTSDRAHKAVELTRDGKIQVAELSSLIHLVSEIVEDTTQIIEKVNNENKKIGGILTAIQEISTQTNLLSLNASIEAARAGEHGQGFAVVATEIRKLAQSTQQSSADIAEILSSIQKDVSSAAIRISEGKEASMAGATSTDIIEALFTNIDLNTTEVMEQAVHLQNLNSQLQEASARINDELNSVSSVTEQSAASVEEVLASAELQQERVTNMVESIVKLNETTQSLNKVLHG
ncbi:methyl-accepting chemotaxis protein [Paenibacillus sp. J45TS6]|uniref:methyl-accepting chemotaxis protein n=1 Tax=Paenibacillus sp. J45TS6 TaxID=2807196 RepID=UPI001AFDBD5E|nr:methyl-accepting chemotaxis protein [Paenibacillus sp. J45TS6]GIP45574.1 methyl-accepting chemotaxis protein [Paenibacillus sp. J45TS6]